LPHMSISTYFRPNIHKNGPEILGVKDFKTLALTTSLNLQRKHL
jgi:hypothetical protein